MKKTVTSYDDLDLTKVSDNFYGVDKDFFLKNKELELRLSSGYINYSKIKNEKDFYEKAIRYITRTAYTLFSFITKEQILAIRLDINDTQAYCSLDENKIFIGLKMLTYIKIPAQLRVDTIIATIYHEMYHKTYTISSIKNELGLKKYSDYYKNPIVTEHIKKTFFDGTIKSIINILEDRRIEANGAEDFPGYSFYFEESRKYAYYLHSGKKVMPQYESLVLDYLMMEILLPELKESFNETFESGISILKKFKELEQISEEEFNANFETHSKLKILFKEFSNYIDSNKKLVYSDDYLDIIKASNDIYNLIPKNITEELNKMISNNEIKGFIKITQTAGGKSFLSEEGIELPEGLQGEIEGIISDELEKIEKEASDSLKNQERKVQIEKIKGVNKNTHYTEFEIIEEPIGSIDTLMYAEAKKISKNICNNLGFLDSKFSRNVENYELTEGELDEDEVYSITIGNKHLFQDVEELPAYSLDFGILLDESGSMSGRIKEATLATLSMILGVKDNKHINLFVYGHTANDGSNGKAIQIYKYFNTLQRYCDYRRIFTAKARSNNADGYAIEKLADIMKESKSRDKILIVVSDGQPSAYGYGGNEGESHVKEVVDRLEHEGITVIQVCMAYIENSPRMFKHFVPFEKNGTFFENLKKILLMKLNQFSDSI
ncbi:MAG: VWA domain-containing protein [Bacteroidia bacterium]